MLFRISSNIYTTYIRQLRPEVQVTGKACPLFVPLVEEGLWQDPVTDGIAKRYLSSLIDTGIDTLILGCTHYPLLLNKILKYVPRGVRIVPQGEYVANSLKDYLMRHPEMDMRCSKHGTCHYLTTESAEKFRESAQLFLNEDIDVERVVLG